MRVKKAQDGCKTVRTRRFKGDKPFRARRSRGPMFQDGGKIEEPKLPGKSVKKTDVKMKKAESGDSLKAVPGDKKKSLGKLPTAVRNKMGFQKDGGKSPKKMMGGGKCKYGC